jgi:hypothetical protein
MPTARARTVPLAIRPADRSVVLGWKICRIDSMSRIDQRELSTQRIQRIFEKFKTGRFNSIRHCLDVSRR